MPAQKSIHTNRWAYSCRPSWRSSECGLPDIGVKFPISIDCVFDASLVPGTCPGRFLDLKGLINKFLESALYVQVPAIQDCNGFYFNTHSSSERALAVHRKTDLKGMSRRESTDSQKGVN